MIMIAKDGSTSNLLNHLRANHSADFKWTAVVLPTEHTLKFYLDFKNKYKHGFKDKNLV